MEQQFEKILSFLYEAKIACEIMDDDHIVHALYNDRETEVRCFFLCGFPHKLMSYSICAKPIPIKNVEKVEANLLEINNELQTGYFYVDEDSQCIAYYNEMELQQSHMAATKSEVLEKFCHQSFEAFLHHRKELYKENVTIQDLFEQPRQPVTKYNSIMELKAPK